jgi:hypothetical protein
VLVRPSAPVKFTIEHSPDYAIAHGRLLATYGTIFELVYEGFCKLLKNGADVVGTPIKPNGHKGGYLFWSDPVSKLAIYFRIHYEIDGATVLLIDIEAVATVRPKV